MNYVIGKSILKTNIESKVDTLRWRIRSEVYTLSSVIAIESVHLRIIACIFRPCQKILSTYINIQRFNNMASAQIEIIIQPDVSEPEEGRIFHKSRWTNMVIAYK